MKSFSEYLKEEREKLPVPLSAGTRIVARHDITSSYNIKLTPEQSKRMIDTLAGAFMYKVRGIKSFAKDVMGSKQYSKALIMQTQYGPLGFYGIDGVLRIGSGSSHKAIEHFLSTPEAFDYFIDNLV